MSLFKEKEKEEVQIKWECPHMKLVKCYRQDITKKLDNGICTVCALARIEKHLFEILQLLKGNVDSKKSSRPIEERNN